MIAKVVESEKDVRLRAWVEELSELFKDEDAQVVLEVAGTWLVHGIRRIETAQEQALPHERILASLSRMIERSRAEAGFEVKRQ